MQEYCICTPDLFSNFPSYQLIPSHQFFFLQTSFPSERKAQYQKPMTKTLPQAFHPQMPSVLPLKARQCPLQYLVAICFFHPAQPMAYNSGEYPTLPGPLRCRILEESLRKKENRGRKYSLKWTGITFKVLAEQLALKSTARGGRGDWVQAHLLSPNRVMERQSRSALLG